MLICDLGLWNMILVSFPISSSDISQTVRISCFFSPSSRTYTSDMQWYHMLNETAFDNAWFLLTPVISAYRVVFLLCTSNLENEVFPTVSSVSFGLWFFLHFPECVLVLWAQHIFFLFAILFHYCILEYSVIEVLCEITSIIPLQCDLIYYKKIRA